MPSPRTRDKSFREVMFVCMVTFVLTYGCFFHVMLVLSRYLPVWQHCYASVFI